ncbi:glycosyltransferase family 4 protein [Gordonia insulae]|uniref:glycosyltransferase family 4 protein n=1 Tax=Gordonia insulae TaxID=2420509 RepID=UPI0013DDC6F7|nr:glycosyltransferase family 4 protein [Gordonia insulae]
MALNYCPEPTGIAPYTTTLARELQQSGHAVRVVTSYPHYPQWKVYEGYRGLASQEFDEGVSVKRLRTIVPRKPRLITRMLMELLFGCRVSLASELRDSDVVVVVSPALASLLACAIRGRLFARSTPMIAWVQDFYGLGLREVGLSRSSRLQKAVAAVESRTLRRMTAVVAIHDSFKTHLTSELDVDDARVTVIKNWTHVRGPSSALDVSRYRSARGWRDDDLVVLHAGNMGKKQDLLNVVNAAASAQNKQLDKLKFVFVGDGSERSHVEAAAGELSNIEFHDPVPTSEFPTLLASADVLLLNEASGLKGMAVPSKLTSYFFAGRPIVAATSADTPAAEEIARSSAGIRVDPANPDELVRIINELAASSDLRSALGDAGKDYFRSELSQDSAITRFRTVIHSVAGSGSYRSESIVLGSPS